VTAFDEATAIGVGNRFVCMVAWVFEVHGSLYRCTWFKSSVAEIAYTYRAVA
jgi:hypothetical protein